jgi:exonuclease VII small subunit
MQERKPIGLSVPHRSPEQIRAQLEKRVEELESKVRQLEAVIRKLDRAALMRKTR